MPLPREIQPDRNASMGGKSFYFFDLDENVFHVESAHFVFHKNTREAMELPAETFWKNIELIGKAGKFKDYEVLEDDPRGSFQRFRDHEELSLQDQPLLQDIDHALKLDGWKGPSWNHFHHAVFNQRPVSVITARGHHPQTLAAGLDLFSQKGHLPTIPNYLDVLPVSHPEVKARLGGGTVPELKRKAIRYSVEKAFEVYGENEHHRFGMSDDDPRNIEKIIEAFIDLKKDFPKNAFFVIETSKRHCNKWEIFRDHAEKKAVSQEAQLQLF